MTTAAEVLVTDSEARLAMRLVWLAQTDNDSAEAEAEWLARQPAFPELIIPAWQRLCTIFGVAAPEAALLQLAIAVAAEPALGPIIATAQGAPGRKLPTEALAKRLFGLGQRPIWRPSGALARWGLLAPVGTGAGDPPGYAADPAIIDWMFGAIALDAALVASVEPAPHGPVLAEWPVADTAARLKRAIDAGHSVRLIIEARPGAGRRYFAAAVAAAMPCQALMVDPASFAAWPDAFMRVQRFASFANAALIWRQHGPPWPGRVPIAPVQIICVDSGSVVPPRDGTADIHVAMPEPVAHSKAQLWRRLAPQLASCSETIALMPGLSLGDLEDAARAAPATINEATLHLRRLARTRMHGIGKVVDPSHDWDDLIVDDGTEARLRRLAFEARHRAEVLAKERVAQRFAGAAGLTALFAGPPGVGKSMAAQVIARDLGVNLLVVDLAATTSKYIGETAKNLSAAFDQAQSAGAVLIFEEADALFAKRTDVRDSTDRHANADTGHLLQLMEAHDGVVILASNRRANIDPAFTRRLRHIIDFPRPVAEQREAVWLSALATLDLDLSEWLAAAEALAVRHDLSPAQIKGAVLSARYTALAAGRGLEVADLEAGAAAESVKEGRAPAATNVMPLRRGRAVPNV
jgi:ATPase family associated with various cellular activities (AAA)